MQRDNAITKAYGSLTEAAKTYSSLYLKYFVCLSISLSKYRHLFYGLAWYRQDRGTYKEEKFRWKNVLGGRGLEEHMNLKSTFNLRIGMMQRPMRGCAHSGEICTGVGLLQLAVWIEQGWICLIVFLLDEVKIDRTLQSLCCLVDMIELHIAHENIGKQVLRMTNCTFHIWRQISLSNILCLSVHWQTQCQSNGEKCTDSRSWSRVLAIACYPFHKLWNWKFTLRFPSNEFAFQINTRQMFRWVIISGVQ